MSTPKKPETPEIPWTIAAGREHRAGMTPQSFDPTPFTALKPEGDEGLPAPAATPTRKEPLGFAEHDALTPEAVARHPAVERPADLRRFRHKATGRVCRIASQQRARTGSVMFEAILDPNYVVLSTNDRMAEVFEELPAVRMYRERATGLLYAEAGFVGLCLQLAREGAPSERCVVSMQELAQRFELAQEGAAMPREGDPAWVDLPLTEGFPATAATIPAPAAETGPLLYRHLPTGAAFVKLPEPAWEELSIALESFSWPREVRTVTAFELATQYQRIELPPVEPALQALATIRLFRHRGTGELHYLSPKSKPGKLQLWRVGAVRSTPWVGTAEELVTTFTECLDETQKPVDARVTPPPGESSPTILPGDLTVGETQAPSFQEEARASYVPELPDGSADAPVPPSGLTTLPWRVVSTGCLKRRVQVLSLDPVGPDGLRRNYAIETPEGVVLTSVRFQRGCPTLDRNGATEEEVLAAVEDRLAARVAQGAPPSTALMAAFSAVKIARHALQTNRAPSASGSLAAPLREGGG